MLDSLPICSDLTDDGGKALNGYTPCRQFNVPCEHADANGDIGQPTDDGQGIFRIDPVFCNITDSNDDFSDTLHDFQRTADLQASEHNQSVPHHTGKGTNHSGDILEGRAVVQKIFQIPFKQFQSRQEILSDLPCQNTRRNTGHSGENIFQIFFQLVNLRIDILKNAFVPQFANVKFAVIASTRNTGTGSAAPLVRVKNIQFIKTSGVLFQLLCGTGSVIEIVSHITGCGGTRTDTEIYRLQVNAEELRQGRNRFPNQLNKGLHIG